MRSYRFLNRSFLSIFRTKVTLARFFVFRMTRRRMGGFTLRTARNRLLDGLTLCQFAKAGVCLASLGDRIAQFRIGLLM